MSINSSASSPGSSIGLLLRYNVTRRKDCLKIQKTFKILDGCSLTIHQHILPHPRTRGNLVIWTVTWAKNIRSLISETGSFIGDILYAY